MVEALEQVASIGSLLSALSRPAERRRAPARRDRSRARRRAQRARLRRGDLVARRVGAGGDRRAAVANLIEETGRGLLFVTHHLALVRSIAQDVAVMHDGRIVEFGTVDEVLAAPEADYTHRLLADTPLVDLEALEAR